MDDYYLLNIYHQMFFFQVFLFLMHHSDFITTQELFLKCMSSLSTSVL